MGQTASSRRNRQRQQQEQHGGYVYPQYGNAGQVPNQHQPTALYPHAPRPQQQHQVQQKEAQTTTVRNLVNLKKSTLTLTPTANDPKKLELRFLIDASQRCSVTIFLLAHEDKRTGKITSSYPPLCQKIYCKDGLSIQFPLEGMDNVLIDTEGMDISKLHAANVDNFDFPLIIRLETLATDVPTGSHTLEERVPGDAVPSWIQSQTTYAVLGHAVEDNDDLVKVVKQRIWVQSQAYDLQHLTYEQALKQNLVLQEIYGITEAHQAAAAGGDNGDFSADCVVCLTNRKNTTLLPCRHFCMCHECARALLKRSRTCPMCRLPISSMLQIQIGDEKMATSSNA